MLTGSGLKVGDRASIHIEYDPQARDVPMHPALSKALAKDAPARAVFEKLTPSRKREILRYLQSLKRETSVARNVERVLQNLISDKICRQTADQKKKRAAE